MRLENKWGFQIMSGYGVGTCTVSDSVLGGRKSMTDFWPYDEPILKILG